MHFVIFLPSTTGIIVFGYVLYISHKTTQSNILAQIVHHCMTVDNEKAEDKTKQSLSIILSLLASVTVVGFHFLHLFWLCGVTA